MKTNEDDFVISAESTMSQCKITSKRGEYSGQAAIYIYIAKQTD